MRGRKQDVFERFFERIAIDEHGCWIWTGALNYGGYGTLNIGDQRKVYAHRWSYEQHVGDIPTGLQLDHLCRVRACVNPDHLEPVTLAVNAARGIKATRTRCVNGHHFTPTNTYRRPDTGTRQCRACAHARYLRRIASPPALTLTGRTP